MKINRARRLRFFDHNPIYGFVRARELEGTISRGPKLGVWFISSYRARAGWGQIPESRWKYDASGNPWPPIEPPELDSIAKYHRILFYQRLFGVDEIIAMLTQFPFNICTQISVPITKQWYSAPNGRIAMPKGPDDLVELHAVQPIGFNNNAEHLIFRNSWGTKWGDKGYGYLSYEYIDKYIQEAWRYSVEPAFITDKSLRSSPGIVEIAWGQKDQLLGRTLHCIDFYDAPTNERVAWSFIIEAEDGLHVEELYVRPQYRLRGHGFKLGLHAKKLAKDLGVPLHFWIPFADTDTPNANFRALRAFVSKLGLTVQSSPEPWARFLCVLATQSSCLEIPKPDNPQNPPSCFLPEWNL